MDAHGKIACRWFFVRQSKTLLAFLYFLFVFQFQRNGSNVIDLFFCYSCRNVSCFAQKLSRVLYSYIREFDASVRQADYSKSTYIKSIWIGGIKIRRASYNIDIITMAFIMAFCLVSLLTPNHFCFENPILVGFVLKTHNWSFALKISIAFLLIPVEWAKMLHITNTDDEKLIFNFAIRLPCSFLTSVHFQKENESIFIKAFSLLFSRHNNELVRPLYCIWKT